MNDLPDGMADDARASWPPRELIDSFLGNFPHDFEWRPGETIEVDGEEAQNQARLFRDVLGRYASGVTVVTTVSDGVPVGMTCQSFTSVSLDPPLVAFLPTRQSRAFASIQRAGTFCVNFLASDQEQVSNQFASSGDDKFAGVSWTPSKDTGSPLLAGIVGHVDCTVHAVHEAGDHYLVIGKVVDLAAGDAEDPLLYYRGGYRTAT
ncbi:MULTISPECIES: flavin reductase family protein [Nocardioides]|uniref:flavin reductase family protein n=1 Tax=Nocardioides TaxID=1839 RepID=UPI001E52D745|nr:MULTISPECIES: flavin reductase family protein [Nocardioides]